MGRRRRSGGIDKAYHTGVDAFDLQVMFQKVVESSRGRLICEDCMSLGEFAPYVRDFFNPMVRARAACMSAMDASRLYVRPLSTLLCNEKKNERHFIVIFRLSGHPPLVWDSFDEKPSFFTKMSLLWHVGPDLGDEQFEYGYLRSGRQQLAHDCGLQVLFMVGLVGSYLIGSHDDLVDTLRFRVLPLPT